MPAKYVRPYAKGQKNDFRDAEAIAEAVQRPTMKFVAMKTPINWISRRCSGCRAPDRTARLNKPLQRTPDGSPVSGSAPTRLAPACGAGKASSLGRTAARCSEERKRMAFQVAI